jgi:PAS domain S-box-containing protein
MNTGELQTDFLSQAEPYAVSLFEYLSDVYFFVKDKDLRFIKVNNNFVKLFGYASEQEIIGLKDQHMVKKDLAVKYENDDLTVLHTGKAITEKKEPVSSANGIVSFHITTKLPVYNRSGEVIGVCGITRDIAKAQVAIKPLKDLQKAVEKIKRDYNKSLKIEELASTVNMSPSTFLRRFKKNFNIPPVQYIRNVRLNRACRLLLETNKTIFEITDETGFCDQSYLTREFKKMTGLSPSDYRKKYKN